MTAFISLLRTDVAEKGETLLQAIREPESFVDVKPDTFQNIPGSPFSYWSPQEVRDLFHKLPPAETGGRRFTKGLCTTDDRRFVRVWWENTTNDFSPAKWSPFLNGGSSVSFFSDSFLELNWGASGKELKAYLDHKIGSSGQWSRWINSVEHYFRPGFTWPLRASKFSPQAMPAGHIFSVRSYVGFSEDENLGSLIALFSSSAFDYVYKTCLGRSGHPEFVVGVVQKLPVPPISEEAAGHLDSLFTQAWLLGLRGAQCDERSVRFVLPDGVPIGRRVVASGDASGELLRLQARIDDISFDLYELSEETRSSIRSWLQGASPHMPQESQVNEPAGDDIDEDEAEDETPTSLDQQTSLVSWSIGVAFGRFDIRLATGERQVPPEPEPFDPLPARSPGMLPDGDAPFMPTRGVFVDDVGHAEDLTTRAMVVYERVRVTPPAPDDLRRTLAKDFFPAHIRMYSKSRRKAPIYWQLATPSASYSVWLYIHAFNKDTLFRVRNDYVAPKLEHERRQLATLRAESGAAPTSAQSRAIETQAVFVDELAAMLDEVSRVAPLWDPDLDDGAIINFAPLWRLVPHHRPWQNELRATWAKLVEGEYDWARLAMRLWPERIVPKCAADRSLAIAHDLEDVLWFEDDNGKWRKRETPTRSVASLIAERTSSAVKAAVASIVEAPDPLAATRRRSRTAR